MDRRGPPAWLVAAACSLAVACPTAPADAGGVMPLGIAGPRLSRLAASPNGQTVYGIDESRRAVVAIDPFTAGRCRDVVAPADEGRAEPVSIAALPGDILALVCRTGDEWLVRTYRTRPGEAVEAARPLQELRLGSASGPHVPSMAVSRSRDWFAVAGLPPPLPSVVRAAFAGAGVRRRPDDSAAAATVGRPVALAVGPGDDLIALEAAESSGAATLVSTGLGGRELLRLDAGVADVRGAACARDGSALWVICGAGGTAGDQPAGVWRLDAVIRDGRQAVRPTCVVRLAEPHALAAVSDRSLVVVHGTEPRAVSRIDDAGADGAADSTTKPQEEAR